MTSVAVLIPVLGRPERVAPLLESLIDEPRATPVFLLSPGDDDERAAVEAVAASFTVEAGGAGVREFLFPKILAAVVDWDAGPGDYARKINVGYRLTADPWVLCAADDLRFHDGWLDAALEVADRTGCGVIGTNDLGNPSVVAGRHATHPLVARWYVEDCGGSADGPGVVYHEGYDHQYVDTELVELAKSRGCFAPAPDSHVEHLHHFWGKGDGDDPTYEKGRRAAEQDARLFRERRKLWA